MSSDSMSFGRPARWFGHARLPSAMGVFAGLTASVIKGLQRLDRWQLGDAARHPRNAHEVMALARQVEHGQPSFAADLRGAAMREADDLSDHLR